MNSRVSRREFVSAAASAAALSKMPQPLASFWSNGANEIPLSSDPGWKDQGVLDLAHSPYVKLRSVPVHAVTIQEGFWSSRRAANVNTSIPSMGKLLEVNGRMDNFRRLIG